MAILRPRPRAALFTTVIKDAIHQRGLRATTARGRHRAPIGSRYHAFDNALDESLWSTLDRELLDDIVFIRRGAARLDIFNYIKSWINLWRRLSSIVMHSRAEFARRWRVARSPEAVSR